MEKIEWLCARLRDLASHLYCTRETKGYHLLSSHFESYFRVRLKLYSFLPVDMLYRSVRNITVSALVNSALVPEYCGESETC